MAIKKIKKVKKLTGFLFKLYKIYITLLAAALLKGLYDLYSYNNLPAVNNPEAGLSPSDWIIVFLVLTQFIVKIVVFINFLRWVYRINYNLSNYFKKPMRFTAGWSVGYFFIPVLNFFRPYQAVKDIFNVSDKKRLLNSFIVATWWALWLISNSIGRFTLKYTIKNIDNPTDSTETVLYFLSDVFDFLLCLTELSMVKKIFSAYSKNFDEDNLSTLDNSSTPNGKAPVLNKA